MSMSWAEPDEVVDRLKTLIIAAHVAGFDETTLRCGSAGTKRYVLTAVTELYSAFFVGQRTLDSFRGFGILLAFAGVVVSDRYQNYFHNGWEHLAHHQACLSHLIRDFEDAVERWPDAMWPSAQRALHGLIRAWHAAMPTSPRSLRTSAAR
jgi:transposase